MYEYKIKQVLKVIDGDTIDIIIDLGFDILHRQRIRFDKIDTPELNSSNDIEKNIAAQSKIFLENWLNSQKNLTIKTTKDDKYGRLLGEIYGDNNESINTLLIENGYAWKYKLEPKDLNILIERQNR